MATNFISGPTIAAGESLSDGIDCSGRSLLRIITPSGWDAAPLTFQASPDGTNYYDLFHVQNVPGPYTAFEVNVPRLEPNASFAVPSGLGKSINFVRLRSGTRTQPVVQKAQRKFTLVFEADSGSGAGAAGPAGPTGPAGATGSVGVTGPTGPGLSGIKGVVNGSEPAAGDIGEFLAASNGPGIALTTAVTANVTTLILPPGDWLVGGVVIFTPTGTGPNSIIAGLGTTPQTMPTDNQVIAGNGSAAQVWTSALTSGKPQTLPTGAFRSNSASNVNVYLVANSSFGGGSVVASGRITARRTR